MTRFTLNGDPVASASHPLTRLLDVLRDELGDLSAKEGCGGYVAPPRARGGPELPEGGKQDQDNGQIQKVIGQEGHFAASSPFFLMSGIPTGSGILRCWSGHRRKG